MKSLPTLISSACLFLVLTTHAALAQSEAPQLNDGETHLVSTEGFYRLSWTIPYETDDLVEFELQEGQSEDFSEVEVLYKGPDLSTTVTGKSNGKYYYRIRINHEGTKSAWSPTLVAEVKHHSMKKVLMALITGAVVFLSTLFVILRGAETTNNH